MYFNRVIYDQNNKPSEIELICNKCGKYIKVTDIGLFDRIQAEYCIISYGKSIICCGCGNNSGDGLIEYKKLTSLAKQNNTFKFQSNTPKCPKCGSTSITAGARGVNFTWGLIGASKTVNRCANCGHTWKP